MWDTLSSSQNKITNRLVGWAIRKGLLIAISGALLLTGGVLLFQQAEIAFDDGGLSPQTNLPALNVVRLQGQTSDLQGAFPVDSVDHLIIQRDGKDAFSLLLGRYKDRQNQDRNVVFFPKGKNTTDVLADPATVRQAIWQEAGSAIKKNAPPDAVILSWWDDGQRIHFLSGLDSWLSKPSQPTFSNPVWQQLKTGLILADETEQQRLSQMARWLTMDYATALSEIRQVFGLSRPIFIVVTNDLLFRMAEFEGYGGAPLPLLSISLPAHDSLHGDIAHIKQWASEAGDGNYLVQKEGLNYKVWVSPKESEKTKASLLVRLLPFVESLKQNPDGLQLVYQSHWGAYLSIYKILSN